MSYFFDNFPEFVNIDSRRDRNWSPVTTETLSNRHKAALPKSIIENATILDLGSCYGATGHWCLSKGAKHYTGVEVQSDMVFKSQNLLSKYWDENQYKIIQQDIKQFLSYTKESYDIIVMIGVIYAFFDHYNLLSQITKICNRLIVIDSIYPKNILTANSSLVEIVKEQYINSSQDGFAYIGAGARPSPNALRIMLSTLGYEDKEGLIFPEPLENSLIHDSYLTPIIYKSGIELPTRYLLRFFKTNIIDNCIVGENIGNTSTKVPMDPNKPKFIPQVKWQFDDSVAIRFQEEAVSHIPDYIRVIDLCLKYVYEIFHNNKNIKIVDVGSALGYTLNKFIDQGYTNVYGIDNSKSMINYSQHSNKTILSEEFCIEKVDVALCNWTLHFIHERKEYIQAIFNNLNVNGLCIITDKMSFTEETKNLYYQFKKDNGISDVDIIKKEKSLNGVLVTKPITWYINTLIEIGFTDIQIVNTRFMFTTIYCRKF